MRAYSRLTLATVDQNLVQSSYIHIQVEKLPPRISSGRGRSSEGYPKIQYSITELSGECISVPNPSLIYRDSAHVVTRGYSQLIRIFSSGEQFPGSIPQRRGNVVHITGQGIERKTPRISKDEISWIGRWNGGSEYPELRWLRRGQEDRKWLFLEEGVGRSMAHGEGVGWEIRLWTVDGMWKV
jgi:hypothetical protein